MSKIAKRFWNNKIHKQMDARATVKALADWLVPEEENLADIAAAVTRKHFGPALVDSIFKPSPFFETLSKKRVKSPMEQAYEAAAK